LSSGNESDGSDNLDLGPEPTSVMTAKQAAESILSWAKTNHLLSKGPVEDAIEDDAADLELLPQQLFESQTVKAVLRKRSINLVIYSEAERKVTIFTQGRLTKGERKIMPFHAAHGVKVEYKLGGIATVRGGEPSPDVNFPFSLHNGLVCCGSSIHPVNCLGAGTFGAIVKDEHGTLFGLTNNHVSGACNCAAPGLPILCPGPIDANEDSISPFTIGRHIRLLPINEGIPENININVNSDAAIFQIEDAQLISSMQGDRYDTPASVAEPFGGMRVEKFGRTTGFTAGFVGGAVGAPIGVHYAIREYGINKTVYFADAVVVETDNGSAFSKAGDSGSLVVGYNAEGERQAVGLVFAGDVARGLSFILPLPSILQQLGVELVYGHNV
jgi:hypothetical protein